MNPVIAAALACQETYAPKPKFDKWFAIDDVVFGLNQTDEADEWTFRGSLDIPDWYHDIQGWPAYNHYLGFCHAGFLQGIDAAWLHIFHNMREDKKQKIRGHSLGAAHACEIAGYMVRNGIIPAELIGFGCPRPGFKMLAKLNQQTKLLKLIKNCTDEVTDVPLRFGPFQYRHACPQTIINEPGTGVSPFKDHHIALYVAGVQKLYGT